MQQTEMLSAVQDTARIPDQEHARDAVQATLQVLGRRLAGGETQDLAAQLPPDLAQALPEQGAGERFGVDDFYRQVAEAEQRGCTPEEGRQHARAVMAAIKAGVTDGELEGIAAQLPPDYADLLGTGPVLH